MTPNPAFINAGGQVDVQAAILNGVNQQQQVQVSYTVSDANGKVLFTSQPVTTTLNVLTTLSTVDLGNLDTTGFTNGDDTITVTVADSIGIPFPGATGTGMLLIGSPVNATLSTTPTTLPGVSPAIPGQTGDVNGTVTTTLQITSPADAPRHRSRNRGYGGQPGRRRRGRRQPCLRRPEPGHRCR